MTRMLSERRVREWIETELHGENQVLQQIRERTDELGLPHEEVFPSQVALLRTLVVAIGASRILELGTYLGYSTAAFAQLLLDRPPPRRLVTVDMDPALSVEAGRLLESAGFLPSDEIEFRVGDAPSVCDELATEGAEFDLVFVDVAESAYPACVEAAVGLLRPAGLMVVDNVLMRTASGWDDGQNIIEAPEVGDHPVLRCLLRDIAEDARFFSSVVTMGSGLLVCARANSDGRGTRG